MKAVIKYGSLGFSSLLTLGLALDLFGYGAYGIFAAVFMLTLFEGGAAGWARMLDKARNEQRTVVNVAMWWCVFASVASSSAEIILFTKLYKPNVDMGFITLLIISISLAVNIVGIMAYEFKDPNRAMLHDHFDDAARKAQEERKLARVLAERSYMKTEAKVNELAEQVSAQMGGDLSQEVISNFRNAFARDAHAMPTVGGGLPTQQPVYYTAQDVDSIVQAAVTKALTEAEKKKKAAAVAADPKG